MASLLPIRTAKAFSCFCSITSQPAHNDHSGTAFGCPHDCSGLVSQQCHVQVENQHWRLVCIFCMARFGESAPEQWINYFYFLFPKSPVPPKRSRESKHWIAASPFNQRHYTTCCSVSDLTQWMRPSPCAVQTPSTCLRHPSFGGRCRKAMLGVCVCVCLQCSRTETLHLFQFHNRPFSTKLWGRASCTRIWWRSKMEANVFLAQWTRRRGPSKDYAAKRTLHLILVWQHSYAEPYKHVESSSSTYS